MKIAIECESLLLQDTLHRYLSEYLCNINDCDFIISDHLRQSSKPIYFLSFEEKTLPFVPERLLENLKVFHQNRFLNKRQEKHQVSDDELKEEIQSLLMEFADRFLQILKKYR